MKREEFITQFLSQMKTILLKNLPQDGSYINLEEQALTVILARIKHAMEKFK